MKSKNNATNGYFKHSHRLLWALFSAFSFIFSRVFLGFRCKDRYRIKKGESVIVLSNHQTDYDAMCIYPCFSRQLCAVATDSVFYGLFGKVLRKLGVIPKKKGAVDTACAIRMLRTLRSGGSLLLFPEGNRYYAEFQYYISPSLPAFIRSSGATLVIFNMTGGSGVSPRFGATFRRGRFRGAVKRILTYEEYSKLGDGELLRIIKDGIRVYDSDSGETYKSRRRAEYLERMLFVCPKCGALSTLVSEKQYIRCEKCGLKVEYGEDLRLHGDVGFSRLVDWWELQKRTVRGLAIVPGKTIFADDGVRLTLSVPGKKRKLLAKGRMTVDDGKITVGDHSVGTDGIDTATVVSGRKLIFSVNGENYTAVGGKRFNPLKYVFLFNRLDTVMSRKSSDRYFSLEDIND